MLTYSVRSCSTDDGSPLSPPALQELQQILGGALIQRGERLIQQNCVGVLQQQPREQSPLELTDGKFGDGPIDDGQQTDRRNCLVDTRGKPGRNLPDRTELSPIAKCDEFGDRNRKVAIKFVLLRQIRQSMTRKSGANDLAGRRPNDPGERLQE